MSKPIHCNKHCDSSLHYSYACYTQRKSLVLTTKPIPKVGKQHKKWMITRRRWKAANPSSTYICHYCGKLLKRGEITLDHKIPRSRAPELRYDFANLVPCCWICNGLKGSVSHDEYKHTCYS